MSVISRFSGRLLSAAMLCIATACTGLRQLTHANDVWVSETVPPKHWQAAISFTLQDSVRVEFFDGRRTRVVTSRERGQGPFGGTPWYRVYMRDSLSTQFRIAIAFPGAGVTTVEYPLIMSNDYFYGLAIGVSSGDARRYMHIQGVRAYPIPTSAQTTAADSLWIYWGVTTRDCWYCGG